MNQNLFFKAHKGTTFLISNFKIFIILNQTPSFIINSYGCLQNIPGKTENKGAYLRKVLIIRFKLTKGVDLRRGLFWIIMASTFWAHELVSYISVCLKKEGFQRLIQTIFFLISFRLSRLKRWSSYSWHPTTSNDQIYVRIGVCL